MRRTLLTLFVAFLVLWTGVPAQLRPLPYFEGSSGLAFALRKLPQTASLLHITAHPDDEDNSLLVLLNRGRGLRTGLLTLTRGDGGQNEIGPELFTALGIIRTGELEAVHRYDGAQQFYTRAYEFGFSYSVEETLEKWGKEEILADMVRIIRTFRPDVIVTLPRFGAGGGQHHQASALLAAEAFRAAGDPQRFPEQLQDGLLPWQARKLYERHRWGGSSEAEPGDRRVPVRVECGQFDPLFGKTYHQIGMEARSQHRCQGMGQLIPLPGPCVSQWKLVDAVIPVSESENDLFDGIDTGLTGLMHHLGDPERIPAFASELRTLQEQIERARSDYDAHSPTRVAPALASGLDTVRRIKRAVTEAQLEPAARDHLLFLLERKEEDFAEALRLAHLLDLQVLADDGKVVPGQTFTVTATLSNGGSEPVQIAALEMQVPKDWQVEALETQPRELSAGTTLERHFRITVAATAEPTRPYWTRPDPTVDRYQWLDPRPAGLPWSPPPVAARLSYLSHGVQSSLEAPAEFRYEGPWVGGEQRHEVMVVPEISLRVHPEVNILPLSQLEHGREVRVTALFNGTERTQGTVRLDLPRDWEVIPPTQTYEFDREGQSLTRKFLVRPREGVAEGSFPLRAVGDFGGKSFEEGFQVIDYHHIPQRLLYHPSRSQIRTLDVRVVSDLKVGYIMGVGDQVPDALQQLEVDFDFLGEEDLAFGDLNRYDVILTGVRAYLNREDLKAYNSRLLQWVEEGGVLIVQYNKYEFNSQVGQGGRGQMGPSPYAPYPVQVGYGRVTDETAPVRVLVPNHPLFQVPNRITDRDWEGWVQERGLYFLGEKSPQYRDLVSTADPFPYNAGEKLGALVEADYGKGRWLYVGLGLWRQLPAGVPGAYRLLANLLSLPKTRR